jgi:hypothetical protein
MRSADFVQDTTVSIAGTSGNGAITLTAIAGSPRLSTALGTALRMIRYVIEDTPGNRFEQGLGTIANNVLTRVRPQVTWDGTTWKDGSANAPVVALPFGATPTSGSIVVRLAPTSEDKAPVINVRQVTLAADPNWRDFRVSESFPVGGYSGQALAANMEYYSLYLLQTPGLLTGAQFEVTVAVAASSMKWALYELNLSGLVGAKICDFNTIDTTVTGVKSDTAIATWSPAYGVWLTPGWYVIGFIPSHAIAINGRVTSTGASTSPWSAPNGYGYGLVITHAGSFAAGLAADASTASAAGTLIGNNQVPQSPALGLRIVA